MQASSQIGKQIAHKNEHQMALTLVAQIHDVLSIRESPGIQGQQTFYPTAELLSRSLTVLGSFPGGYELRINTSENISPKLLHCSLGQSIYCPGAWLKF